jgi:multiple sugar transport system ATP-binding protein
MNFVRGTIVQKDGHLRFLENDPQDQPALGGLALAVPDGSASGLQSRINRPVWLGVRPEHLQPAANGQAPFGTSKVEFVEHLGAESWVHLRSKAHSLTLRCEPGRAPAHGETLGFGVESGKERWFDGQSGQCIP